MNSIFLLANPRFYLNFIFLSFEVDTHGKGLSMINKVDDQIYEFLGVIWKL